MVSIHSDAKENDIHHLTSILLCLACGLHLFCIGPESFLRSAMTGHDRTYWQSSGIHVRTGLMTPIVVCAYDLSSCTRVNEIQIIK